MDFEQNKQTDTNPDTPDNQTSMQNQTANESSEGYDAYNQPSVDNSYAASYNDSQDNGISNDSYNSYGQDNRRTDNTYNAYNTSNDSANNTYNNYNNYRQNNNNNFNNYGQSINGGNNSFNNYGQNNNGGNNSFNNYGQNNNGGNNSFNNYGQNNNGGNNSFNNYGHNNNYNNYGNNNPYYNYNQNNNQYPYYERNLYAKPHVEPGSSFSTASMVLGIISIVACFTFTIYPAFVMGSIAIVLGLLSKGKRPALLSKARVGVICASLGLVINTVIVTCSMILLFTNPEVRAQVNETFEKQYGMSFDEMWEEIMEDNGF